MTWGVLKWTSAGDLPLHMTPSDLESVLLMGPEPPSPRRYQIKQMLNDQVHIVEYEMTHARHIVLLIRPKNWTVSLCFSCQAMVCTCRGQSRGQFVWHGSFYVLWAVLIQLKLSSSGTSNVYAFRGSPSRSLGVICRGGSPAEVYFSTSQVTSYMPQYMNIGTSFV